VRQKLTILFVNVLTPERRKRYLYNSLLYCEVISCSKKNLGGIRTEE
jgi:hypothetical protein